MRNDQDIGFQYFCLSIQTEQFVLINCVEDYIFSARARSLFLEQRSQDILLPVATVGTGLHSQDL